jgi:predicted DNA-binding transcriptional regulator AlpA
LITITEIAEEYGVSRATVHNYRRGGTFPRPAPVEGTEKTKLRFRADEVAAWFEANPKRQGKRTDLATKPEGDPMTDIIQEETESADDWRVPLRYTREELADLLDKVEAGQYARMLIADYPDGGDTYVIVQSTGSRSIRFNRLRVVDDPQYARDLAAVLLAWADREERHPMASDAQQAEG